MMPGLKIIALMSPLKQFHVWWPLVRCLSIILHFFECAKHVRAVSVNGCSANQVGFPHFVGWIARGSW